TDDGTEQAGAGVAPVLAVLRVPRPLLGEAVAEDVTDASVEHGDLAVVAAVHAAEVAGPRRPVLAHLAAGVAHQLQQLAVHLHRARGVEQYAHLDAGAGALRERFGDAAADVALPPDVALDVDRLLRGRDVGKQAREEAVTVLQ